MKFLDSIPFYLLAPIALLLAASPLGQQPHLLQKLSMLFNGELTNALDVFDLLMHGVPISLLVFLLYRKWQAAKQCGS